MVKDLGKNYVWIKGRQRINIGPRKVKSVLIGLIKAKKVPSSLRFVMLIIHPR